MPSFSSESPFATPPQQQPQQAQQPVAQQPQQQTFQPAWDEQTTRYHTGMYRKNPTGYNEEQLNSIRKHAEYHHVPFYEGEFSILEAIKQFGGGFFEGFTTFNWMDPPDNEYEAISRNLGHLSGFVPGLLAKPLKALGAVGAARRLGALKSVPMVGADFVQKQAAKIIAPALKSARKSRHGALKSATNFLLGQQSKHIFQGAFHLGTASAISGWQQGIDGMIEGFKGGAMAGGIFRSIGNFINVGDPTGNKLVRAMAGSLFMGLPATYQGHTTPEQIYEYVMGAYFGGMEGPWTTKYATDYLKKMEKRAKGNKRFRVAMDPEQMPGWEKVPTEVQPIIKKYAKEGIPGTEFTGYGDPVERRQIAWMAAKESGALKGFTDKGEAIFSRPGFEATSEIRDGERIYKLKKEVYEKWDKYGTSGLGEGGDMLWDSVLAKFGMPMVHYTWTQHSKAQKKKGVKHQGFEYQLSDAELAESDAKIAEANISLAIPKLENLNAYKKNLLRKAWYQVKHADAIFAVDKISKNNRTLQGDSKWSAQMGIDKQIPVWVLNSADGKWYQYKRGPGQFAEVKPPKELPMRSTFIGDRGVTRLKNAKSLKKSMETLINANYKPIKGKIPPLKGKTSEDIKVLRKAKNEVLKENDDLAKEFNANRDKIDKEQDLDMLTALKTRQKEIKEILTENKKEIKKLDKELDLERYDKEGNVIESPESDINEADIDNNQKSSISGIGNKTLQFVNKHLENIWKTDKYVTVEQQAIKQSELAEILNRTMSNHLDKESKINKSNSWISELEKEIGDGYSLNENARREMRQWLTRENQNEYVQMWGYDGVDFKELDKVTPFSKSGMRKQQKSPYIRLDEIWQSYGKEGRAFGILDHVTIYDQDGRKVDLNLTSYRQHHLLSEAKFDEAIANAMWREHISSRIMPTLEKKGMYIFGGKSDSPVLMFAKYHPLSNNKQVSNKEGTGALDLILKNDMKFQESLESAKTMYKMKPEQHLKQYISNILYDMEMNGFKISGKDAKSIPEILDIMTNPNNGFINTSKAYNKRSQIWGDVGYKGDKDFVSQFVSDLTPVNKNYKFIIAKDLADNVDPRLAKYIETVTTELPEHVDGAIITRRDVLEANVADAGIPKEAGNSKSVIVSPNAEHGALLGKYMMHDAGIKMSEAMKKAGIHYIMMDSAVKQRGARSIGDYEIDANWNLNLKGSAIYELPVKDIRYNFSTFSDNHLAQWQKLPKQVLTNILTTNWKSTDKDIIDDMLTTLVGERFRGESEWNTKLENLLEMSKGPEKDKSIREITDNLDKIGMVELLNSAKLNGQEKLSNAIYTRLMKQSKSLINAQLAEGEITKEQKMEMIRELNDANSVAETVMKVSPGLHSTLHKYANKYRYAVIQNYVMDSLTKPKVQNSLEARMRPFDKALQIELNNKNMNDEIFYLDDGYRNTRIEHNIKGGEKYKTLGELWDNRQVLDNSRKATDETANIDKVLNALVLRVPMDSMSGAHKLKFLGFTGRKGQGVLLHGRTMRALGGADLDADAAFVFFGGKGGFKESWKDAYNANKKEYYKAEHKRTGKEISFNEYEALKTKDKANYKLFVGDNKLDTISESVKKKLNIPKNIKTYKDLLTINELNPLYKYGLEGSQEPYSGLMYSPVERIRISEAAYDGRAMLGHSAVNPKQLMSAAYSAILAKDGTDSWTFKKWMKKGGKWKPYDYTIKVEARTDKDMQSHQRQLMRAMVGFASDPLDEAGLKSSEFWFKNLFNAHFKIQSISSKDKTAPKVKGNDLKLNELKGTVRAGTKSMYAKFYDMNSAMFGRNGQMNRRWNMSEIQDKVSQVNLLAPEQMNSSLSHLAKLTEPLDWSDSITSRVSQEKLSKVYTALKDNIKQYDFLKELMGRDTFAVPESKDINKVLEYRLFDIGQIKKYARNPELFVRAIEGTSIGNRLEAMVARSKFYKSLKDLPYQRRMDALYELKTRADDFLVNDVSDMVSLISISDLAKTMSSKELKKIPEMQKFAEQLKVNSWLMARERRSLSLEELSDAVTSKNAKTKVEKLWEKYLLEAVEEGQFGPEEARKLKMKTSESASLDQVEIDKRILNYKSKLNPKEQKMFDLLMLGTYKRGDLAKINKAMAQFEKMWDPQSVNMVRQLKNEAATTSLSQLGYASKAIDNSSKKLVLDKYGSILKDAFKPVSNKEIKKEMDIVNELDIPSVEKELPEFVAEKIVETGLEGLEKGKVDKEMQSVITSLVDNLKSYNNKIAQDLPSLTRGILQKNLNAMNKQDWVAMDNFFKEIKKGTIFQAFSKGDLQELSRRHYWLFPKTVNRELMKYDLNLLKGQGWFLDRAGALKEGLIKKPTHYQDMLQLWIGRMNEDAARKTDEWNKILQESLMFVNSVPEGEALRRGAVHKRQLGYAEKFIQGNKELSQAQKAADSKKYFERWKKWEKRYADLLDKEFVITHEGKRKTVNGRKMMQMINKEYTVMFKNMHGFITGKPEALAKFSTTKVGDEHASFNIPKFIAYLKESWGKGIDVSSEFGVDGLRYIARAMMQKHAKRTGNKDFQKYLKSNKLDNTGKIDFEFYWPHMMFNKKDADNALFGAYKKIRNDATMEKETKTKELKNIILKHKKLTGDWNFQDVEEWDIYDQAMSELAKNKELSKDTIKWFSENQRMGSMFKRSNHIDGWSADANVPETYIRSLANTYYRQLSNIFSREIIHDMTNPQNSFYKKFGKEQAHAWANYMKLYVQDALGNATVIPDYMYNMDIMKLKGTPYASWADNRVRDRINKILTKLGIGDKEVDETMRGVTLQQVRNWSNLEAQYEMASLLAHPKSMVANIFGGTMHTVQSAGISNFRNARDIKWLKQNINDKWNSMKDVDNFVTKHGVLPEYMLEEFGTQKAFQQQRNIDFIKDVAGKLSRDPEMSKETLSGIQKKYGVKDKIVQFAANFMTVPERAIRRDAFMAHYINAWKKFGGAIENPDHPFLVEMAKKGVKATQFLYSAPYRPAFARTALGKVMTRFQLWSWNAVRFRNDVSRQARIYGLRPGTESYEKYKRTRQIDLFMFALANMFAYSLFETALPAPWNWLQDTADWVLGDETERNKAFFGQWPTKVAPLQMITPPILRMVPATARAILDDDWSKMANYQIYTMLPFGRMIRDVSPFAKNNLIENPIRLLEKTTGLPHMQFQRFMGKEQKVKPPSPGGGLF